jgi:hypothetical protein
VDDGLAAVTNAWPRLSAELRAAIAAMVRHSTA